MIKTGVKPGQQGSHPLASVREEPAEQGGGPFSDLHFWLTRDGTILDYRADSANDLYRPPEDFLGRRMQDILPPAVAHEFDQAFRKVLTSKAPASLEYPLDVPSGTKYFDARIFLWGQGQISVMIRDITGRKRAEDELAAEKELLAVTLASIAEGVVTTDLEKKVVLVNRAAEEMMGTSLAEVLGQPLQKVLRLDPGAGWGEADDLLQRVQTTGEVVELPGAVPVLHSNNGERLYMLRSAPRHDFQGQVIGVVTVFRDVTDSEKMAEERLKASKLESIGTLAGGIAHDFNNILTAILGNISLAKFFLPKDHQVVELLHKAESAGERAKDLTYQLLTFARGGAPVKRIAPVEPVVRSGTQFALHGANVSCEFQIAPDLWMVEVDERQMSQAISNLVLNAVQAMPDGGMIRVTAENKVLTGAVGEPPVGGKFVKIAVEDKGVGIPAEHLHRVFDPYFTTKTMGIGLGLATTYSIVKQHRGYIHVTSELGRGTRFDVFLPAGHMKIKPVTEAVVAGEGEVAPARGTGRILVMDDEVFILELSIAMLRHLGYEPTGVFDGGQALKFYAEAMAEGRPFDLVVMDLTIAGGMGGKEAIRKLIEMDPKACAIVSSGYANDPIMADYSDYGFSGVLRKPYDLAELSRQLQKVLGAKRQA